MENTNDVLTSFRPAGQIPLNRKEYSLNEITLKNLGINNNLAYTYHKGLEVTCIEERTKWEWKEVQQGDIGLVVGNFTYPNGIIVDGVDYSNKTYNFVKIETSAISVVDATNIIKGILKLSNDLGGTADNPTTPTAIHKTGNEAGLTGIKGWTNVGNSLVNGIALVNTGTNLNGILNIGNTSTGTGVYGLNTSTGEFLVLVGSVESSGFLLVVKNNNTNTFTLDKLGNIIAKSYTKQGGTSDQYLMADGTIRRINPQKDTIVVSNYTITDIDNGTTIFVDTTSSAITISLGAITLPEFCVGFIHKAGVNDITYTGVTNPIGLKSLGAGYQTFIERELNTGNYYLLGNTKV